MGAGMRKIQKEEEEMDKEGYGGGRAGEKPPPSPPPPPKPVVASAQGSQMTIQTNTTVPRFVGISPLHT